MYDIKQLEAIKALPEEEQKRAYLMMRDAKAKEGLEEARANFLPFMKKMWPGFIEGAHHRIMADAFDRVISGDCKRLIINMAPRHTKSEFSSWGLPTKYMGMYPDRQIMQLGHNADLAVEFGGKVRDTLKEEAFQEVYPGVELKADQKAAGRWKTNKGGRYVAMGIGGKLAGRGADLLIIDDAHSEQEYIRALGGDSAAFDDAFEWYQTGPRQRLQPDAAIVVVMTRWHKRDLTGRLIDRMTSGGKDQWEVIEFPCIFDEHTENERALWPEFWRLDLLQATREELSVAQWNAQYQQNPTSEEGAIVKREWWKKWERSQPPEVEFIIQSWDTAFKKTEAADYSACTTWGVFMHEDEESGLTLPNIMLLDAYKKKLIFPDLKAKALEMYHDREPDSFLIEDKGSGTSLIQEFTHAGIPVVAVPRNRGGGDKMLRLNMVSDIFKQGMVWAPDKKFSEMVIEEVAEFPFGDHDDLMDSMIMAVQRFRDGGFVRLPTDEDDEDLPPQKGDYY